jgi:cyclopropane-fatty-acyl-phospholipid synthase
MKSVSLASEKHLAGTLKPGMFAQLARKLVLKHLQRIDTGCINLTDGSFTTRFGQPEDEAELVASIEVLNASFYADIAFGGSIGAGEAYMQGSWRCEELVNLVRILVKNRHVLDDMEKGSARLTRPLQKLFHWFNRNTREVRAAIFRHTMTWVMNFSHFGWISR